MRIQHNITAMNSYRNFSTNSSNLGKNLEKLSSGYKINRAGDDAAGLAISEKMRAQITGLEGATKNAKDGISLIQTAEGALTEVHSMLNRMTTLAEQSANGTYQNELDREQLQKEVSALKEEIDRVADSTNFNGLKLLDGSLSDKFETTKVLDSAISNIQTGEYAPKGESPAVSTEFINARPAAATTQHSASFVVDLKDATFNVDKDHYLSLKIGDTTISVSDSTNGITTAAGAVAKLVAGGKSNTSAVSIGANGASTGAGTGGSTTAEWNSEISGIAGEYKNQSGKYVMIDGHAWEMTAVNGADGSTATAIKFTQVDNMGTGGKTVDANYGVSLSSNQDDAVGQQPNWRVLDVDKGEGVGTSQQARAKMNIDFTQLKDGDQITIGTKTYTFAIGEESSYTASVPSGTTKIDLTGIFEKESDQSDKTKQKQALDKITDEIGIASSAGNDSWYVGRGDLKDNVGTLTLQSKAPYNNNGNIGGVAANGKADMRTEASVMKQLYSARGETAATTSFDVDVTKIKAGDTFTINGQTFEFTDGEKKSSDNNVAIDLKDEGITGGISMSQTGTVMQKIKRAIEGGVDANGAKVAPGVQLSNGEAAYKATVDGNKLTLTAKEDNDTVEEFELRTSAKVETPTEIKHGEGLVLQIGDTAESYNKLTVSIEDMHSKALGIGDLDISTQEGAAAALDKIKSAINSVSDTRGNMGALQNRLDHTINNLGVMRENIQSAESVIRDTDVAEEMMTYTKNNILNQSAQAMLAQANQLPQGVLQLLG